MLPNAEKFKTLHVIKKGLEIWEAHIDALKEQDKNAHYMEKLIFETLTENIKTDKHLESLPLCCWSSKLKRIEIISGHHRIRSARAAGVTTIVILIITSPLSKAQIVSKQLAHNAIVGKDDVQTLKELFESIDDMSEQLKTGLDPTAIKAYQTYDNAKLDSINFDYDYQVLQFVFLPENLDKVIKTFDFVQEEYNCLANIKVFGEFIKAMRKTSEEENVRNASAILLKMCDIVKDHYTEKK